MADEQMTQYVKPRQGFKIPDPDRGDFLPEDGRSVPKSIYWATLIRDGDVVVVVTDRPAKRVAKS